MTTENLCAISGICTISIMLSYLLWMYSFGSGYWILEMISYGIIAIAFVIQFIAMLTLHKKQIEKREEYERNKK